MISSELFYMFILRLILTNIVKKASFFALENMYLGNTSSNEKLLINIIIEKNNISKVLNLHSKFDKDMNSAILLNVNQSDIILIFFIRTFKSIIFHTNTKNWIFLKNFKCSIIMCYVFIIF